MGKQQKYFVPRSHRAKGSAPAVLTPESCIAATTTLPPQPSANDVVNYVRFVLKSGAALELNTDTVDEVSETWAGRTCHAVTGNKLDGTKVAIPVENIDYMEESQ